MMYRYGMRIRPAGPGCQPKDGFKEIVSYLFTNEQWEDIPYHDIIEYDRPLTVEEMEDYQLDDLQRHYWVIQETNGNFICEYDNKEDAEFDLKEFGSDLGDIELVELRICPICLKQYTQYPALSRHDNETEICPQCGVEQALLDYIEAEGGGYFAEV